MNTAETEQRLAELSAQERQRRAPPTLQARLERAYDHRQGAGIEWSMPWRGAALVATVVIGLGLLTMLRPGEPDPSIAHRSAPSHAVEQTLADAPVPRASSSALPPPTTRSVAADAPTDDAAPLAANARSVATAALRDRSPQDAARRPDAALATASPRYQPTASEAAPNVAATATATAASLTAPAVPIDPAPLAIPVSLPSLPVATDALYIPLHASAISLPTPNQPRLDEDPT